MEPSPVITRKRIRDLQYLEKGWSSYEDEVILPKTCIKAEKVYNSLLPLLASYSIHPFPLRDGRIQLDIDPSSAHQTLSGEVEIGLERVEYAIFLPDNSVLWEGLEVGQFLSKLVSNSG